LRVTSLGPGLETPKSLMDEQVDSIGENAGHTVAERTLGCSLMLPTFADRRHVRGRLPAM